MQAADFRCTAALISSFDRLLLKYFSPSSVSSESQCFFSSDKALTSLTGDSANPRKMYLILLKTFQSDLGCYLTRLLALTGIIII